MLGFAIINIVLPEMRKPRLRPRGSREVGHRLKRSLMERIMCHFGTCVKSSHHYVSFCHTLPNSRSCRRAVDSGPLNQDYARPWLKIGLSAMSEWKRVMTATDGDGIPISDTQPGGSLRQAKSTGRNEQARLTLGRLIRWSSCRIQGCSIRLIIADRSVCPPLRYNLPPGRLVKGYGLCCA